MKNAKEKVDITALLQGILNGYPGNSAIFREYVQNSDDAKAEKQVFILDERTHPGKSIVDPDLRGSQGPALIAINDGLLSERDWEALKSINSSSKKADETQTGKNGLGFRASYHLTENPHVLSGNALMILDPHHRFVGDLAGGIAIDVTEEGKTYADQLAPFAPAVGDPYKAFNGTVFRLPLRTAKQAQESKIKNSPTSVSEICDLLYSFGSNDLEELVLFLRHITSVEIRHIDSNGTEKLIGRVKLIDSSPSADGIRIRTTLWEKGDGKVQERRWAIRQLHHNRSEANQILLKRLGYDVTEALTADKLTPTIELAIPLDNKPIRGSLYTLLPLPVKTGFPLHLNAVFALTPDRQSLKNIEESGTKESRERRLIEWNKVIFDTWTPAAWADLLNRFSSDREAWSIWPPAEKGPYWIDLTANLLKEVVHRKMAVIPTVAYEGKSSFVTLEDPDTLLASSDSGLPLVELSALGVKVVQPPAHLFSLIQSCEVTVTASVLNPPALHRILVKGYQNGWWKSHASYTKKIIEYLIFSESTSNLSHLIDIPWFQCTNGSSVSFRAANQANLSAASFSPSRWFSRSTLTISADIKSPHIIPSTEEEARLFLSHPDMIAWSCLEDKLRSALLKSDTARVLAVTEIKVDHVVKVLNDQLQHLDRSKADPAILQWVVDFLTWLEGWPKRQEFFSHGSISSLLILPTSTGGLRRLSEKAVHFDGVETQAVDAWEKLSVPVLTSKVSSRVAIMLTKERVIETPQSATYMGYLLDAFSPSQQNALLRDDFLAIQRSLYAAIIRAGHVSLSQTQKTALANLAIFSIRLPGHKVPAAPLCSVSGTRIHIKLGNIIPLPIQPSSPPPIYVDLRERETEAFAQLLEPVRLHTDFDLVGNAFDNWPRQPEALQNAFIEYVFDIWRKLPTPLRRKLEDLPFVTVNGTGERVAPKHLIHPDCWLTALYAGEAKRVPVGRFAESSYVTTLQHLGFLPHILDQAILLERLRYLSGPVSGDEYAFAKSKYLVELLNRFWDVKYHQLVVQYRGQPWLPLSPPCALIAPNDARDRFPGEHSDPVFYDLVLQVLREDVIRTTVLGFRSALGWSDRVPIDILVRQMHNTLALPRTSPDRSARLSKLIYYLSRLHDRGQLSSDDIDAFQNLVHGRPWLPVVSGFYSGLVETVKTEHALLAQIDLKPPFHQIQQVGCQSFLIRMGCTMRPLLTTLIDALQSYNGRKLTSRDLYDVKALLAEITESYAKTFDPKKILVPGSDDHIHPLDHVFFRDREIDGFSSQVSRVLEGKIAAHNDISQSLSNALGVQTLSSLLLDLADDALDDDEPMAEDLVNRIQGFLKEYDIRYAFNEFLANADDAGATKVTIAVDGRHISSPSDGLIGPSFRAVHEVPSVFLYNDATMSDDDFKGLRQVGRGGKVERADTHGRHGLGALSFYYFTDVATVISGEYVMILDPSGKYLPRTTQGKRTCIIRTIADLARHYPNQLLPCESLFNFSKDTKSFKGTLFWLPLNSTISITTCDLPSASSLITSSYRSLGRNAFFFTNLQSISAVRRQAALNHIIWSYSAHRENSASLRGSSTCHYLQVTSSSTQEVERWLISSSGETIIPKIHETTARGLKLANETMVVKLAINVQQSRDEIDARLFSTLPLPKATSLPFHLHARFAISSNRQSIVFDSPDQRLERDPKSAYNAWILQKVVPPLYLATLEVVIDSCQSDRWWLVNTPDDISNHTAVAFRELLSGSNDSKLFKVDHIKSRATRRLTFREAVFAKRSTNEKILRALMLLEAPQLVTSYPSLAELPFARTVDASYVRDILLNQVSKQVVENLYASNALTSDTIIDLLSYVCNEPSLVGLPLLLLASGAPLSIPGIDEPCLYLWIPERQSSLFSTAKFLRSVYSHDSFKHIWSSTTVNVQGLSVDKVPQLIEIELALLTDDSKREDWLKSFWSVYPSLPGPPSLSSLENANLRFVRGTTRHLSLQECQRGKVVFIADSPTRLSLIPALEALGIEVLRVTGNDALKKYLAERFPTPVESVLTCLQSANITNLNQLPTADANTLIDWLKKGIDQSLATWRKDSAGIQKSYLSRLEIWDAISRHSGRRWYPANGLQLLPSRFPLEDINLLPNNTVAPFSTELNAFVKYCRDMPSNSKTTVYMSPQDILNAMDFPSRLTDSGDFPKGKVQAFFKNMFGRYKKDELRSISGRLTIYDGDGNARPLSDLYDHRVELFAATLSHTARSSFVHSLLRSIDTELLVELGLNHGVSIETFRVCAKEVEAQGLNVPLQTLHEMCRVSFGRYTNTLPSLVMGSESTWASLDSIAFVRPKDTRRQGASYSVDRFCSERQAPLLPPSRFVLARYEPIAWTQRALFFTEPDGNITILNKKLGVPGPQEVVAHLVNLTTEIAQYHPNNSTLLSDITATYKWLNDNADVAGEFLEKVSDKKLFLNVDDPNDDNWHGQWVSVNEIVLNLYYDFEEIKRVRAFLRSYETLLHATGCKSMNIKGRTQTEDDVISGSSRQTAIMKIFDEMRKQGELTDVAFVASFRTQSEDDEHVVVSDVENEREVTSDSQVFKRPEILGVPATNDEPKLLGELEDSDSDSDSGRVLKAPVRRRKGPSELQGPAIFDMPATNDEPKVLGELKDVDADRMLKVGVRRDGGGPQAKSKEEVKPVTAMDEYSDTDADIKPFLRAHRALLAAAIPYFRDRMKGWGDSRRRRLPFHGTDFGAKALLDFVYTGNFDYPNPSDDANEQTELLFELLDLLPRADEWDMSSLRSRIETSVIDEHKFVQRLPLQHANMRHYAELYKATRLADALDEWANQNPHLLKKFSEIQASRINQGVMKSE